MASAIRTHLCNKVCLALRASGATPLAEETLLPLLQVNSSLKASDGCVGFTVSLQQLQSALNIAYKPNGAEQLGSRLVSNIQTDETLRSASLHRKDHLALSVYSPGLLSSVMNDVLHCPQHFWSNSALLRTIPHQRVVVEFSSPNIAKPFHVGHLRSTVLGHSLARLHTALSHTVTKLNYLGDWGTQFGLLKWGYDAKGLTNEDLSTNAVRKLSDVYVFANQQSKIDPSVHSAALETVTKLEAGDPTELNTWRFFREISIKDLRKMYERLDITFDEYHGESDYKASACTAVLQDMRDKGLLERTEDGREVFQWKENKRVTVVKSDGSSIYLSRDIAAAIDRFNRYQFDRHYYVVDNAQIDHFRALFSGLQQLGYTWAQRMRHIRFGRILGMSSRKGNAAFLTDLLDEGRRHFETIQEQTETTLVSGDEAERAADVQALSAFVVADLQRRRHTNYKYSWEAAVGGNGTSATRLQYTHCRLIQLESNCGVELPSEPSAGPLLGHPCAIKLLADILRFDEILYQYHETLEPRVLVLYLSVLCKSINSVLKQLRVKGAEQEDAQTRLALLVAARHTLAAGMTVLGLTPLHRM